MAKQARSLVKKLGTVRYPVVGALAVAASANAIFDVKKSMPDGVLSKLWVRFVGSITKVGAAPGAATGRENPEELVVSFQITSSPNFGGMFRRILSVRSLIMQQIFDRGFSVRGTDLTDAAGTVAVDFSVEVPVKYLAARRPIEFGLPMRALTGLELNISCGGRDRLFTGGTPPTWDFSALNIELWSEQDRYVSGTGLPKDALNRPATHYLEEYQVQNTIAQAQADFKIELESGYEYGSILLLSERDSVAVDDIISDIGVESGARVWLPRGDNNATFVRRMNQGLGIPSEVLVGCYYIPLLPDGMASRAGDAIEDKMNVIVNVTPGAGTTRVVTAHVRRFKRMAVPYPQAF